jgi:peptidoglycan/xylan/chitin deacetylase (PgdA/CDA1 family)
MPSGGVPGANVVGVDCSAVPCVALTFDDGPSTYRSALLDQLKALNVHVTFFDLGQSVAARPELLARSVAEGHAVGGHSWRHGDMVKAGPQAACEDANRTRNAIKDASGVDSPLVRPPYGAWDDAVLAACTGMTFVLWDVDTMDWATHDGAKVTDHVLNDSRPGSIILMHDTVSEDIAALPGIVAGLKERGYTLVTVPQLWAAPLETGRAVFNGPRATKN